MEISAADTTCLDFDLQKFVSGFPVPIDSLPGNTCKLTITSFSLSSGSGMLTILNSSGLEYLQFCKIT